MLPEVTLLLQILMRLRQIMPKDHGYIIYYIINLKVNHKESTSNYDLWNTRM